MADESGLQPGPAASERDEAILTNLFVDERYSEILALVLQELPDMHILRMRLVCRATCHAASCMHLWRLRAQGISRHLVASMRPVNASQGMSFRQFFEWKNDLRRSACRDADLMMEGGWYFRFREWRIDRAPPGWLAECYRDDPWHQGGDATVVEFKIVGGKRVMLQQPVMKTFWIAAGMGLEVPLTWSIESLQPHQRDLLQVYISNGRTSHTFPPKEIYRCSNGGWVALSAFAVYTSFKMPRKGANEALDDMLAFSHRSPNAGILDSVRARHFMEPDVVLDTSP